MKVGRQSQGETSTEGASLHGLREAQEASRKDLGNVPDVVSEGHPERCPIGIPEDLLWFTSEVWQNPAWTCWNPQKPSAEPCNHRERY